MVRSPFHKFRILGPVILIITLALTVLILFYIWTWLNPTGFWEKLVLLILSIVGGFLIFVALNFVIAMVFTFIVMLVLRRKMKKVFKKFEESSRMMYE